MPSSLPSTSRSPPPTASTASRAVFAEAASIGRTGRPTTSPTCSSDSTPPTAARRATSAVVPASMVARRTTASGTAYAFATAPSTTPSSAPWRRLPVIRSTRKRCSSAVARPIRVTSSALRDAVEPAPAVAASRPKAASTSATVRLASSAGSGSEPSERNPTPRRRWGRTPERWETTTPTSAGSQRAKSSASAWVLAVRDRVAATARDAVTTSASVTSISASCLAAPTAGVFSVGRGGSGGPCGDIGRRGRGIRLPGGSVRLLRAPPAHLPHHDPGDDGETDEHGAAGSERIGDGLVGGAGEVAAHDHGRGPQHPTERVEHEEGAVAHVGRPGERRHDGTEEGDPPTEHHGPSPASGEQGPGVVEPVVVAPLGCEVMPPACAPNL